MAVGIQYMRRMISGAYPSWRWDDKVSAMPDNQVKAIYFTMLNRGTFDKKKKDKKEPIYKQLSIFDFGVSR